MTLPLRKRLFTVLCKGKRTVQPAKKEPVLFCQENMKFGRKYALEGVSTKGVCSPWSADTYSPWSFQLRTLHWIPRRPRCEQHQSWHKPAWLPQTGETRTYRWQPCPLSVSHISSGCWQDGTSGPEVPCSTEAMLSWLHNLFYTGRQKKDELELREVLCLWIFHLCTTRHANLCTLK